MEKINIDTWLDGYKVRACDWVDGKTIYVNVQYIKPGGRIDSPEWEKTAYVIANEDGIFMVKNCLSSIVTRIVHTDFPEGKRICFGITAPEYLKRLFGVKANETTVSGKGE